MKPEPKREVRGAAALLPVQPDSVIYAATGPLHLVSPLSVAYASVAASWGLVP
ncbi:MAG: hypothetical protein KGL39_50210 [Patescibacteria group bacterium]|nr:hypothetical protein [Patescibacteria group bacterium]